jgi:hypothetical protein
MDLAAAGAAAAQIGAAQRAQQVSIAALRSNQLQAQSMASVLANAAGAGAATAAAPVAPPASGGNGGDTGGGSSTAARGSLLNILV